MNINNLFASLSPEYFFRIRTKGFFAGRMADFPGEYSGYYAKK